MTPLIKRPQRKTKMRQQRTIEHRRAHRIAPQGEKPDPAGFHRFQRDQAERMVEQVGRQIGQQNKPGDQSRAANIHIELSIYYESASPSMLLSQELEAMAKRRANSRYRISLFTPDAFQLALDFV